MLRGESMGVIVGNYTKELEKLKSTRNIYFAKNRYAGGILEGIKHYKFINKLRNYMI
jgi:sucrose-phosphate synthase